MHPLIIFEELELNGLNFRSWTLFSSYVTCDVVFINTVMRTADKVCNIVSFTKWFSKGNKLSFFTYIVNKHIYNNV